MEQELSELTQRMQAAFGERLLSVILYGSAASGDWNGQSSDLNILCVLNRLAPQELADAEPIARWWRDQGHPSPLLLTDEEVENSTDCFPMEFHDMQEHRRVLFGRDLVESLVIDRSFYRAQVEHELRAKHIRLRQKAAEVLRDGSKLWQLMADSLSTFCVLGRHALLLSGREARWKKEEVLQALEQALGQSMEGANAILAVRVAGKPLAGSEAAATFASYLGETEALVRFVDQLDR